MSKAAAIILNGCSCGISSLEELNHAIDCPVYYRKRIAELEDKLTTTLQRNVVLANERNAYVVERDRLREALESIDNQTNDCAADETYYGGVWREVNLTARTALEEK